MGDSADMLKHPDYENRKSSIRSLRRVTAMLCAAAMLLSSCGTALAAINTKLPDKVISDPLIAPIPAPSLLPSQTPEAGAEPTPAPDGEGPGEESEFEAGSLNASGDGWIASLYYPAEARIPEDAVLTLTELKGSELYSRMKTAVMLLKNDADSPYHRELGNEGNHFYTVGITDAEGNPIRPQAEVTLAYRNFDHSADCAYFSIGEESRILETDKEGTLRLKLYQGESFGYGTVQQVQVGTVQLTHSAWDYMVTASYGPEAGLPAGTELKVREIMPGTAEYARFSGMTDEALNEEWSEITLERYFDISFAKNGEKLEPKADVDVRIIFRDKIELTEEHDVQAVQIENNEATVIDAETESNKAAKHDAEAIDTVAFSSDSMAVSGVVQTKKITTKVMAADGNTYEIEVVYTQEAGLPENAEIKVTEIPKGSDLWEAYRKQTAAALDADDVRLPGLYDISIIGEDGTAVEPNAPVSVSIKLANAETGNNDLRVVHFTEEMPQELVAAEQQAAEITVSEEEKIESETVSASVDGDTVTFDTQSFSVYAFAYTVDFEYSDGNGSTYAWSFPGRGSYPLTDILAAINRSGENVTDATLSVVEGEDHDGALYLTRDEETGEYILNSDIAFTDVYRLTIRTDDGGYVLQVTDSQATPLTVEIHFKDHNGEDVAPVLSGYWAVYASFEKESQTYYRVKSISAGDETVITALFTEQFGTGGNDGGGGTLTDYTGEEEVTVKLLCNPKDSNLMNDKNIKDDTIRITDGVSAGGYTFTFDTSTEDKVVITAARHKPYRVVLRFQDAGYNPTEPSGIANSYYIYAGYPGVKNDGTNAEYCNVIGPLELNGHAETVLNVLELKLDNQASQYYSEGQELTVCLIKSESGSGFYNASNGGLNNNVYPLVAGNTLGEYEITSIHHDVREGQSTIILRKVSPYGYSVSGFDSDGTTSANVDLSGAGLENNWYVVTKLTKTRETNNNVYYSVHPLSLNGNGSEPLTGESERFLQNGNDGDPSAVYVNGDRAETRLIRMNAGGKSNQEIIQVYNQYSNDSEAGSRYGNGDGVYTYTLRVSDSSGAANIRLIQSSAPTVTILYRDTDGKNSCTSLLGEEDQVYLLARLTDDPDYRWTTPLAKVGDSETMTIPYFEHKDNASRKYLTGEHEYSVCLTDAYGNAFADGSIVGRATVDLSWANGNASRTGTTIRLIRIPEIMITSRVFSSKSAQTPDGAGSLSKHYYLLLTAREEYNSYYHLEELDPSKPSETFAISYLTDVNGSGKHYYLSSGNLNVQLLTSDNAGLNLNDAVYNPSSRKAFGSGNVTAEYMLFSAAQDGYNLTTTLRKVDQTGGAEHKADIFFFDYDRETVTAIDPALGTTDGEDLSHHYYILATLKEKASSRIAAWQLAEIDKTETDGEISVTLDAMYRLTDADGNDLGSDVLLPYDPDIFTVGIRLYHRQDKPDTLTKATDSLAADLVPGYDFMSNTRIDEKETTEIKLHKAYEKDYKVRLSFDPASPEISQSEDKLWLLIKADHRTTGAEYGLVQLGDIAAGTAFVDYGTAENLISWYAQDSGNWTLTSATITGNETITLKLLKADGDSLNISDAVGGSNCRVYAEGEMVKACLVSYTQEQTRQDENNNTTHITDYVKLTKLNASNDFSFTDILGQGVYYGITANTFNQRNHIQSNFAVNQYDGQDNPVEADLASESGAFVAADILGNGRIFIGQSHSGEVLLYVNPEQAATALKDPRDFVYVIPTPKTELTNRFVNPIIAHGATMSSILKAHNDTFTPALTGTTNHLEIDTLDFPENATIYLDGDLLKNWIASTGQLELTKRENQTIVFNFDSTDITLNKFVFRYSRDGEWIQSDTPTSRGDKNQHIDQIAKHIVWNMPNATNVTINISTGIFLIPNSGSTTTVTGTSSGWVITGGTFINTSGEWHSVYGELPSVTKTNLNVGKTIDGKMPNGSQIFIFHVDHLVKGDGTAEWNRITTEANPDGNFTNTNGTLKVENITEMQDGWNIYRITESEIIPDTTQETGDYTVDDRRIYAAVKYEVSYAAGGNAARIATNPIYYIEDSSGTVFFSEAAWNPDADTVEEAFGAGGSVRLRSMPRPAFENVTKKDRLSITKEVEGTTDNSKEFSFTLTLQVADPQNNTWSPWNGTDQVSGEDAFTIQITGPGSEMTEPVHIYAVGEEGYNETDPAQYHLDAEGTVAFTLKAGQTAAFNGLPEKHRYTVTETNPTGNPGYTLKEGEEASRTHMIENSRDTAREIFTNVYTASGSVDLTATKKLQEKDNEENYRPVVADQFGFELWQDDTLLETQYNDEDGNIAFTHIVYSETDMEGATDNGDGTRTKAITYTIREIEGTAGVDMTGITFDEDKTITVMLTDDGEGHLTVQEEPETLTAEFVNTFEITGGRIAVEKKWFNKDGNALLNEPESITFDLYRVRTVDHEHDYQFSQTVAPSCTENGYDLYVCSKNSEHTIQQNFTPAAGHTWSEWNTTKEATEDEAGSKTRTCSVCGATETETISPLSHTHSYTETVVAPTCTEQGYTRHECVKGDDTYTDTFVPATGHSWGGWTTTTEATASTTGVETRTCSVCGATETRTIPAISAGGVYPGTTIQLQAYTWPTWADDSNSMNTQYTINPTGIFVYDGEYYVVARTVTGNAYQMRYPSMITNNDNAAKLNGVIVSIAEVYGEKDWVEANLQKGTLAVDTDGSYYVYMKNDAWSGPPTKKDGWYKIPGTGSSGSSVRPALRHIASEVPVGGSGTGTTITGTPHAEVVTDVTAWLGNTEGEVAEKVGTYTIRKSEHADWKLEILIDELEDAAGNPYRFYAVETNPGAPDYLTRYENEGVGKNGIITIKNQKLEDETGRISVTKQDVRDTEGNASLYGTDDTKTFVFEICDENEEPVATLEVAKGQTATTDELPIGHTYTVSETTKAEIDGYSWTSVDLSSVNVALVNTETVTVSAINYYTRDLSKVAVKKIFYGISALPDGFRITNNYNDQVFNVGNANGSGTEADPYYWEIDGVPTGTKVTFTETGYQDTAGDYSVVAYAQSSDEAAFAEGTAASATSIKDDTAIAYLRNDYGLINKPGTLIITKEVKFGTDVTPPENASSQSFEFSVGYGGKYVNAEKELQDDPYYFSVSQNESVTLTDLTPGAYTVTENPDSQNPFTGYAWVEEGSTTEVNATIPRAGTATAALVNNYLQNKTDIRIIKIRTGSEPEETLTGAMFRLDIIDGENVTEGTPEPVDENGKLTFSELPDGEYQIVETQAPAGYIGLNAPIHFTISDGTVTLDEGSRSVVTYIEANGDDPDTFKIGNTAGSALPATGGTGTLAWTLSGLALVALAGILLVSRRRRKA